MNLQIDILVSVLQNLKHTLVVGGEGGRDGASSQAALMQRMTFALSRMLNDPGTC